MRHPTRRPPWFAFAVCLAISCVQVTAAPVIKDTAVMTEPSLVHHDLNYIELTVVDMAAAQAFYRESFGWSFNEYGPEYTGIRRGAGEMGGLRLEADGSAVDGRTGVGVPLVLLYSADLDATLASVRSAGGRIVVEPFDFPGGRRFHFQDPSGNELAVYSTP